MSRVLAFDFGASSGRAILGAYENGELSYREVLAFLERQAKAHPRRPAWELFSGAVNLRVGEELMKELGLQDVEELEAIPYAQMAAAVSRYLTATGLLYRGRGCIFR